MRVAVFTDADLDRMDGSTRALEALVLHAPSDVSPKVYGFAALGLDAPDCFLTSSEALYVPGARRFLRRLREDNVDVLHAMSTGPAGIVARYFALDTGLPLVASIHRVASEERRWRSTIRDLYRRWYFRSCDCVLAPSAASSRELHQSIRSSVWSRGVDAAAFTQLRRSSKRRDEWHVSSRRPAVLVAGTLTRQRGADLVHRLSSWLYERRISHRFIVVGDGPMRDDVAATCPDACLLGRVPQHELSDVFASADVLLYPTDAHSGCTLLLEAQASGLPVVVSGASNAKEHMRPGDTGYVCRARDVSEFGTRLAQLLVDAAHREEMGHAARRYAMSRSWTASLAPIYALYRTLAGAADERRAAWSAPLDGFRA